MPGLTGDTATPTMQVDPNRMATVALICDAALVLCGRDKEQTDLLLT
jgi:hypothetical protein